MNIFGTWNFPLHDLPTDDPRKFLTLYALCNIKLIIHILWENVDKFSETSLCKCIKKLYGPVISTPLMILIANYTSQKIEQD